MDGMIGGVGGVGMGGGIGGIGAMGGAASSPAMGNATAASSSAQTGGNAPASSPDFTVNISGTARAALAADASANAIQQPAAYDGINKVSITVNVPQGISTVELQNLLNQNEWDNLIADLLLALLLQKMQNR